MSDYLTNDVVLVRYPFSDLQMSKVRPAIIVSALHISQDVFIGGFSIKAPQQIWLKNQP